jgi:hypothetical protein
MDNLRKDSRESTWRIAIYTRTKQKKKRTMRDEVNSRNASRRSVIRKGRDALFCSE